MTDELPKFLRPTNTKPFHRARHMTFFEYFKWRRGFVERDLATRKILHYTREFLDQGEPRFLAVFAHDGNGHIVNCLGRPESWQFDVIFDFLTRRDLIRGVALDVGANLGLHTLFLARRFERVIALEPHPKTFHLLAYNLASYAPNATAYEVAAFSEAGKARLNDGKPGNTGTAQISSEAPSDSDHVIETVRIDDFAPLQDLDIGFMKLDVEGKEREALLGAEQMIRRHRPVILLEDWNSKQGTVSDSIQFLTSLGYKTFLEPVAFSDRWRGGEMMAFSRVRHFWDLFRHGHTFALRRCNFMVPKGYELILALHGEHESSPE